MPRRPSADPRPPAPWARSAGRRRSLRTPRRAKRPDPAIRDQPGDRGTGRAAAAWPAGRRRRGASAARSPGRRPPRPARTCRPPARHRSPVRRRCPRGRGPGPGTARSTQSSLDEPHGLTVERSHRAPEVRSRAEECCRWRVTGADSLRQPYPTETSRAVCGANSLATTETTLAGNPPRRACSRIVGRSSSGAQSPPVICFRLSITASRSKIWCQSSLNSCSRDRFSASWAPSESRQSNCSKIKAMPIWR